MVKYQKVWGYPDTSGYSQTYVYDEQKSVQIKKKNNVN